MQKAAGRLRSDSRRRVLWLILILAAITFAVGSAAVYALYLTAFEQQRARVEETAKSWARLIEAVARFDARDSQEDVPGEAFSATLQKISEAHQQFEGFGETGEFTLARLEDDQIVFLLSHRHRQLSVPEPVSIGSNLAEPMRRALAGESGTVEGLDYRGAWVLAAYEPVAQLDLGLVAKIDVSEIRAPYVRTALLVSVLGLVLIGVGAMLFRQVTEPLIRSTAMSAQRYSEIFENVPVAIWEEDFSEVSVALGKLQAQGVTDYRQYFDEHPEFVARAAKAVKVLDVNKQALVMHGAGSKDELLESIDLVFGPEAFDTFRDELVAMAEGAPSFEAETVLRTLQGRRRQAVISVRYSKDKARLARLLVSTTDTTRLKEAEALQEEREQRYRSLVEAAPLAIIVGDSDGMVSEWNPAAAAIFRYSAEEIVGRPITTLLPERYRDAHTRGMERFRMDGGSRLIGETVEFEGRRKDGTEFPIEISVVAWKQQGTSHFGAMIQDITAKREAAAALDRTREQLLQSQKLEAVGQLTGGIAHDFNNILTVIAGFGGLALEKTGPDEPIRGDLELVVKAGEKAADLTRQLMAFSRLQVLQPRVLDLNQVVTEFEKFLRRTIGEDIELDARLAPELGRVKLDPVQIDQVLLNLAMNARDAMPAGGKLTLETENVELDEGDAADRSAVSPGRYVLLAVTDSGRGMDEATRARIFEPFFTTKPKGEGTGLGLSTVYGIVKQSDGYIWASSELGEGTTFKIYLPRVEGEVKPVREGEAVARGEGGSERILVAEDDAAVRQLVVRALEEIGYQVLAAQNPDEALQLCSQAAGSIDLLVTDLVMPGGTGAELAERIMSMYPETKTLYMSGYADKGILGDRLLGEEMDFLAKPFAASTLARKVREILDRRA